MLTIILVPNRTWESKSQWTEMREKGRERRGEENMGGWEMCSLFLSLSRQWLLLTLVTGAPRKQCVTEVLQLQDTPFYFVNNLYTLDVSSDGPDHQRPMKPLLLSSLTFYGRFGSSCMWAVRRDLRWRTRWLYKGSGCECREQWLGPT